jgi:Cu+-exporting ATPase
LILFQIILALVCTLPLVLSMFGIFSLSHGVQLLLATVVQFGAGYSFYLGAWKGLIGRRANMDLLVAIGTTTAFGFSGAVVVFDIRDQLYFETSAVLISFILIGRLFEAKALKKAREGLETLLKMEAKTALIKRGSGVTEVKIEEVKIGDLVIVKPGEKLPVDGEVIRGKTHIDESMLTGESLPIKRGLGDRVYAGTINGEGVLEIRTSRLGKESRLGTIIEHVKQAQNSKAPIQKVSDKVSSFFIPVVLGISLITALSWGLFFGSFEEGIINGIAVLIIACPCALGLAIPIVLMVACAKGAKEGILIKEAEGLEKSSQVDTFIIDKTGTVTEAKLIAL